MEKLLSAFDTEEEIAERAKEKATQEELSKIAEKKTESIESKETSKSSTKPSISFGKILYQLIFFLFLHSLQRIFSYRLAKQGNVSRLIPYPHQ